MASLSDMLSDPIGSIGNHISENPYSTAATVIGAPMTMGFSSLLGAAGRAADSYNQSVAADAALANDIGISPEGPDIGRSRTTSALADFFGDDAADQKSDIQDAGSNKYDGSLGFDPSLDQGDEYGPGAYTSTPGSAIGVDVTNTFDDATSALDAAIAAALGSNARGLAGPPGQVASMGPTNTATNGFYGAYDAYGIHGGGDAESGANSYGGWDAGGGTGAGWGADGNWVGDGGYGGGGSVGGGGGQTAAEAAAGFAAGSMGAAEGAPGAMFDDDGNIGIDSNYAGGGGGGGGGGGDSVICTELYRQGLMPSDWYKADQEVGAFYAKNDPDVLIGYHRWGKPVARAMRKSKIITWFAKQIALPWAREMYIMQGNNGLSTIRGKILCAVGPTLCKWLAPRKKVEVCQ